MSNLPTQQQNSIFSIITKSKPQFELALPKGANVDRNVRELITLIKATPALQKCSPESIMACALRVMGLGLELNLTLGHAYLVPYGQVAQLQIGYKGMLDLALRSGKVKSISAREVYQNDVFNFEYGTEPRITHIPSLKDRGELIAVYAIAFFDNGATHFEVLSKDDVEKIRNTSKMKGSMPWTQFYGEMARKTAIRRLFKYLPISVEMNEAISLDEMSDAGKKIPESFIETEGKTIDDTLFGSSENQETMEEQFKKIEQDLNKNQ